MSESKNFKIKISLEYDNETNKHFYNFIERECQNFNCWVKNGEWQSKYRTYLVYNYEPLCADGFKINLTLESNDKNSLIALKHYYDKKISMIEYLNNCYSLESYKKEKNKC